MNKASAFSNGLQPEDQTINLLKHEIYVLTVKVANQDVLIAEQNRLLKERQEWALHTSTIIRELRQQVSVQRAALQIVKDWQLPATGEFWPSGAEISYEANWGSLGARRYICDVAADALDALPPTVDCRSMRDTLEWQLMRDTLEQLKNRHYNPFEPDNQSASYKRICDALNQVDSVKYPKESK